MRPVYPQAGKNDGKLWLEYGACVLLAATKGPVRQGKNAHMTEDCGGRARQVGAPVSSPKATRQGLTKNCQSHG
jgi:hypothetical protein